MGFFDGEFYWERKLPECYGVDLACPAQFDESFGSECMIFLLKRKRKKKKKKKKKIFFIQIFSLFLTQINNILG